MSTTTDPDRRHAVVDRTNRWLDVAGLLSLAFVLAVAWLTRPGPAPPSLNLDGTEVAQPAAGITEWVLIGFSGAAVSLVAGVMATFGRPGAALRLRRLLAVPFAGALLGMTAGRVVALLTVRDGTWPEGVNAQSWSDAQQFTAAWDGALLAASAGTLVVLVLRQARLTRRGQALAVTGVVLAIGWNLLISVPILKHLTELPDPDGDAARLLLVVATAVVAQIVFVVLGVVLLRGLLAGRRPAVAGLVVWGLVTWLSALLPASVLSLAYNLAAEEPADDPSGVLQAGLDWTQFGVVLAGAALLPVAVHRYVGGTARHRVRDLSAASLVLAVLVATFLVVQLGTIVIWGWAFGPRWEPGAAVAVVVSVAGLAGAALLWGAGRAPGARMTRLLAGGALLLVVPQLLILIAGPHEGSLLILLTQWDGPRLMLVMALPLLLTVLTAMAGRARD